MVMPLVQICASGDDMLNAEKYDKSCINLPMFPTLTEKEQEFVIEKVLEFYD